MKQSKKWLRVLSDGAAPIECECERGRRRYDCRRYDSCLGFAAANDWNGFSCEECLVDDRDPRLQANEAEAVQIE